MDRLEAMAMLIAAVDKGSLSAAARELNVPAPTLTRKVTDLEAALATKLLTRSTRKLMLTDTGASYVAAARRILEMVDEQEREAAGEFTAPRGDLTVASSNLFGRLYVLPQIIEFLAVFPEINVKLMQSDLNVDLISDHVDLAVRLGNLPDSGLIATKVGSVRIVLCASPAFLAGRGIVNHPAQLAGLPVIRFNGPVVSPDWGFRGPGASETITVPVRPRLQVSSPDAAVEAAVRGIGYAQLLHYHVFDAVAEGKLRIVLPEFEPQRMPVHLVHVSRNLMPMKLRRFIDFIAPRLRDALSRLQ